MDEATTFCGYMIRGQVAFDLTCRFRVCLLCTWVGICLCMVKDITVVGFRWSDAPVDEATTCDFEKTSKGGFRQTLGISGLPRMICKASGIFNGRVMGHYADDVVMTFATVFATPIACFKVFFSKTRTEVTANLRTSVGRIVHTLGR
jgi:hypothetical protein